MTTSRRGGRAGVIVPNGVLFGSSNVATKVHKLLLTECDLHSGRWVALEERIVKKTKALQSMLK